MRLFVVTIEVYERGLLTLPGVPKGPFLKLGDEVALRRPDGSVVTATIAGTGEWSPVRNGEMPLLLADLTKEQIPPGTEVWATTEPTGR
ncbi:MAG: hypothetical protein U0793_03390 [Gemmataceae bacterium]